MTATDPGAHLLLDFDESMESMEGASVKARELSIVRDHPGSGPLHRFGPSKRLARTPPRLTSPAGPPGFDARAVVSTLKLPAQFEVLVANGVLAEELPQNTHFIGIFR